MLLCGSPSPLYFPPKFFNMWLKSTTSVLTHLCQKLGCPVTKCYWQELQTAVTRYKGIIPSKLDFSCRYQNLIFRSFFLFTNCYSKYFFSLPESSLAQNYYFSCNLITVPGTLASLQNYFCLTIWHRLVVKPLKSRNLEIQKCRNYRDYRSRKLPRVFTWRVQREKNQ